MVLFFGILSFVLIGKAEREHLSEGSDPFEGRRQCGLLGDPVSQRRKMLHQRQPGAYGCRRLESDQCDPRLRTARDAESVEHQRNSEFRPALRLFDEGGFTRNAVEDYQKMHNSPIVGKDGRTGHQRMERWAAYRRPAPSPKML